MIFRQWKQVLDGTKTQTRRLRGDRDVFDTMMCVEPFRDTVFRKGVVKWRVGNTYAVQPGRGRPAIWIRPDGSATDTPLDEYVRKLESGTRRLWGPKVKVWLREHGYIEARIRITKIRRERLKDISLHFDDIQAEGVKKDILDVGYTWLMRWVKLWDSIYRKPYRWDDNPDVWVLEFESGSGL